MSYYQNMSERNGSNPMSNMYYVTVDGDKLYQFNVGGGQTLIGYTASAYEDVVQLAQEYRQLLVDHGIMEKEKTAEELAKEQSDALTKVVDMMGDLTDSIQSLASRMDRLEGTHATEASNETEHERDSKPRRKDDGGGQVKAGTGDRNSRPVQGQGKDQG